MHLFFESVMEINAHLNRCLVKQYDSSERGSKNAIEGIWKVGMK